MSFTLVKVVRVGSKRTEDLLQRIAEALERLAPEVEEAEKVEFKVEEVSPILEPSDKQKELDEEEIPENY